MARGERLQCPSSGRVGGGGWVKNGGNENSLSVDRGCTTTRNGRAYTGERARFMDFQANSWTRDRTPNNTRRCPIDPDSRWIRLPKFSTRSPRFLLSSFSIFLSVLLTACPVHCSRCKCFVPFLRAWRTNEMDDVYFRAYGGMRRFFDWIRACSLQARFLPRDFWDTLYFLMQVLCYYTSTNKILDTNNNINCSICNDYETLYSWYVDILLLCISIIVLLYYKIYIHIALDIQWHLACFSS